MSNAVLFALCAFWFAAGVLVNSMVAEELDRRFYSGVDWMRAIALPVLFFSTLVLFAQT